MKTDTTSSLLQEASIRIADEIHQNARYAKDGNVYWRGPTVIVDGRAQARPVGPYLYPGTLGIALFLAACERHRRSGIDRDLALRAIAPLRREISSLVAAPDGASEFSHLLGGLSGFGSFLYGLVEMGDLLDVPEIQEEAHLLSSLLTPEAIRQDRHFDVMFGSAGALLALLALERRVPARNRSGLTPLELANLCARHLLDRQVPADTGGQGWPNGPTGKPVGGFAHGSAGICYALLRLFQRTGDWALRAAALKGMEHERSLFVPEEGNWRIAWRPELRFVNTWCNGAPGIALGRIGGLEGYDDPRVRQEAERALELTRTLRLDEDDHVCCGNMGRVEVLLFAYRKLGDPGLLEAAERLAESIVHRAEERQSFGLMPSSAGIFDPRFFLGLTGIGYTLLHLADPAGLPSVIALDS
jgi:type 2 lantibiotic biosynthesis protein LanM